MKKFRVFCTTFNIPTPFPLSEQLFCSYLADQNLGPHTIKSYPSGLCNMQISLSLPDPREQSSLRILKQVQVGISRTRMPKGSPPRIRLPITSHILMLIKESLASLANLASTLPSIAIQGKPPVTIECTSILVHLARWKQWTTSCPERSFSAAGKTHAHCTLPKLPSTNCQDTSPF